MLFYLSDRGGWWNSRACAGNPWEAASPRPEPVYPKSLARLGPGSRTLVLRTLIEDFGGEATCLTVWQAILRRAPVAEPESELDDEISYTCIRRQLHALGRSGAVTLEAIDATRTIARITLIGAIQAYEPPLAATADDFGPT